MYIEHALKKNNLEVSVKLANCFVNIHTISSVYSSDVQKEIDKNCPLCFKNGIRIPDFYIILIKKLIN